MKLFDSISPFHPYTLSETWTKYLIADFVFVRLWAMCTQGSVWGYEHKSIQWSTMKCSNKFMAKAFCLSQTIEILELIYITLKHIGKTHLSKLIWSIPHPKNEKKKRCDHLNCIKVCPSLPVHSHTHNSFMLCPHLLCHFL